MRQTTASQLQVPLSTPPYPIPITPLHGELISIRQQIRTKERETGVEGAKAKTRKKKRKKHSPQPAPARGGYTRRTHALGGWPDKPTRPLKQTEPFLRWPYNNICLTHRTTDVIVRLFLLDSESLMIFPFVSFSHRGVPRWNRESKKKKRGTKHAMSSRLVTLHAVTKRETRTYGRGAPRAVPRDQLRHHAI